MLHWFFRDAQQANRIRMLAFILLTILGLNISQASGKDNSTQMYYSKLTIDVSAREKIPDLLTSFVSDQNLKMEDLQITTNCTSDSGRMQCICEPNYKWSEEVCHTHPDCCGGNKCTFTEKNFPSCVSNREVSLIGSLTLNGSHYHGCLKEDTSPEFSKCNERLLQEMKKQFSTLRGFHSLNIIKYSAGSVIAAFKVSVIGSINPQDVTRKSTQLAIGLKGLVALETTGILKITMPPNPVEYNSEKTIECNAEEDMGVLPVWQLNNTRQVANLTSGTDSYLKSTTMNSTLKLMKITEMWEGEYTCAFHQKSDFSLISHKATAVLNVSLLPNINITVAPSFPRCASSDLKNVNVKCEIPRSTEPYTVKWIEKNIKSGITASSSTSEETISYTARAVVSCDPNSNVTPAITCQFQNRLNQPKQATTDIHIIYEGERYCEAEGEWEDTKLNFTAVLPCFEATGERRRMCNGSNSKAVWEAEESFCVNNDIHSVLQKSETVNSGFGEVEKNAADVLSNFKLITNKTEMINTFANMNASVHVLASLSERLENINTQYTVDDFLDSSSNLLNTSLENSWISNLNNKSEPLAERYLSAVERLITITNLTSTTKKKPSLEVQASLCTELSHCNNRVFGVSVSLRAPQSGMVKTAGFKELQRYLPNSDEGFSPNSIVVSTTTEKSQLDSVTIVLDFPLLQPRPPNVKMKCVAWDNRTNSWSDKGCEWAGAHNEGRCTCHHLSSFAILMSRSELKIPWIEEITYVGLSVSLVALVVNLVVELAVWSSLVKTKSLYLRHTAHINISMCLLVANCCFLASSDPRSVSDTWCPVLVVLKHFFYLAVFFWMLVLSSLLLHQAVFPFHQMSKRHYLRWSFVLGYACPFLLVAVTFLCYGAGDEGSYFHRHTCWLVYTRDMIGSIYTFVVPVGIIVFFNIFSMLLVIMKLVNQHDTREFQQGDKSAAKLVMRTVILLTPIFGATWLFGFATMMVDNTDIMSSVVNYIFALLNSFQGLFILLTTCLGDQLVRQALLNCFKKKAPSSVSTISTEMHDSKLKQ